MRTLLLFVVLGCAAGLGCAAKNANSGTPQPSPVPQTAMDAVQVRACESCRHNLELCHQRIGGSNTSGPVGADCMNEFISCLNLQQLDTARCQGMN